MLLYSLYLSLLNSVILSQKEIWHFYLHFSSRLLDFWLGYLRHKDNLICHFYNAGALLQQLYISDLENAYEEMLLSLQPLSVLPFQLDLDFVSGNSCHEPPNGEFLRLQDTTTSLPDLRAGAPIHGSPKFSLTSVRYEAVGKRIV